MGRMSRVFCTARRSQDPVVWHWSRPLSVMPKARAMAVRPGAALFESARQRSLFSYRSARQSRPAMLPAVIQNPIPKSVTAHFTEAFNPTTRRLMAVGGPRRHQNKKDDTVRNPALTSTSSAGPRVARKRTSFRSPVSLLRAPSPPRVSREPASG